MALNLKNYEVEMLAQEIAVIAGSSKTEAIRQALLEKKQRLQLGLARDSRTSALQFLHDRVWPTLPPDANSTLSRQEEEAILGYGPDGAPI